MTVIAETETALPAEHQWYSHQIYPQNKMKKQNKTLQILWIITSAPEILWFLQAVG